MKTPRMLISSVSLGMVTALLNLPTAATAVTSSSDSHALNSITSEQEFTIVSDRTDQCLDEAFGPTGDSGSGGQIVHTYPCHKRPNQRWIVKQDGSIVNVMTDRCLDDTVTAASGFGGVKIHDYACHGRKNQKWKIRSDRTILNVMSGKCLDEAYSASSGHGGAPVHSCDCHANSNQRWTLKPYSGDKGSN